MGRKTFNCPGELTLHLIGGKWKVIVLWLVRKGPQRSGKIRSRMPGVTPTAFSRAVRELEADGILRRRSRGSYPLEVSYELTSKGETLAPIVRSLVRWGLTHQGDHLIGDFGMARFFGGGR